MRLSENMTAREMRDTVMSLYLEASYKEVTASAKYGWEEPQKIIQAICLTTAKSATPKSFQTNICPLSSQKLQNHLKQNEVHCFVVDWYKNFSND